MDCVTNNLLLQKRSDILNELRVFFCKYDDPLYVKVEKLDIMVRLSNEHNVGALLRKLKEYISQRNEGSTALTYTL